MDINLCMGPEIGHLVKTPSLLPPVERQKRPCAEVGGAAGTSLLTGCMILTLYLFGAKEMFMGFSGEKQKTLTRIRFYGLNSLKHFKEQ